jgi:hypothetical protein
MTEPDILNISRVPGDLLLEIAALYTLIAQKNEQQPQQQGQNRDGTFANESAFERPPDHVTSAMMMKMSTPVSQTPMGYYPSMVSHHPGGASTATNTLFKPIQTTNMNNVNVQPTSLQTSFFSSPTSPPAPPPPPPFPQQQQQQQPPPLSFTGMNIIY